MTNRSALRSRGIPPIRPDGTVSMVKNRAPHDGLPLFSDRADQRRFPLFDEREQFGSFHDIDPSFFCRRCPQKTGAVHNSAFIFLDLDHLPASKTLSFRNGDTGKGGRRLRESKSPPSTIWEKTFGCISGIRTFWKRCTLRRQTKQR